MVLWTLAWLWIKPQVQPRFIGLLYIAYLHYSGIFFIALHDSIIYVWRHAFSPSGYIRLWFYYYYEFCDVMVPMIIFIYYVGWKTPSDLCFCRVKRPDLLTKWRVKGGVLLIGYSSFRNLSLGKHVKDKNIANEITYALQVTYHVSCYCLSLFQALMLLLDGFFWLCSEVSNNVMLLW